MVALPHGRGPCLLVSVTDMEDTLAALQGGADIIDVKDPGEGPLGAPPLRKAMAICHAVRTWGGRQVSLALGEFPGRPRAAGFAAYAAASCRPDYIKIGFPGFVSREEATATLLEALDGARLAWEKGCTGGTPPGVVAVAYADFLERWSPEELVELAHRAGATGCLIDTWDKRGPGLLGWLKEPQLTSFARACRDRGLLCALAGRLTADDLPRVARSGAHVIGVRSGVCRGDRIAGRVDPALVARFREMMGQALERV